jgi:tetrapyrrole methylase family protein/MazG family protein
VAQCWSTTVLSGIKLSVDDEPPEPVVVLQRLGLPDEAVFTVSWADLDREVAPDHLTSIYIPRLAAPIASELRQAAELIRVLRARCPWDREQTHASLARHLLEETYEVLEAIDHLGPDGNGYPELEDELGDLLFQVLFHAALAAEAGQFGLADVARHLHDKLVERHPHVFGDEHGETAAAVMAGWERRKQRQLGRASLMEGIPAALPSLAYATKVLGRAESASAERRRPAELAAAVEARLRRLAAGSAPEATGAEAELGELLLDLATLARQLELDPETALRRAVEGFRHRFMEAEAGLEV